MPDRIDKAGRVVIPKERRRQLGVSAGEQREATADGGRVEREQVPNAVTLVEDRGWLVVKTPRRVAQQTDSDVRKATDEQRAWPRS